MYPRRFLALLIAFVMAAAIGGCSATQQTDGTGDDSRTSQPGSEIADTTSEASEPAPADATSEATSGAAAAEAGAPEAGPEGEVVDVPELLQFEATTLDGAVFDGSSLVGKPTVLWFWAPWCTTCIGQIPQVEAVAAQYVGEANVVGVGGLDSDSAIEDFAADLDGLTSLVDDEGAIWQRFEIIEQSSFVILDADGQEVARSGYSDELDLSSEVAGLLN